MTAVSIRRQATASHGRFTTLDAYRGIAALMIVVFHVYQHASPLPNYLYQGTFSYSLLRGLEAGVAFFFVLSGFLLFLPFARATIDQKQGPGVRGFLLRRALRILPLYYLVFLAVWTLRYNGYPGQIRDLVQHLTFTQVFDREHFFWTVGPSWSLALEVMYYIGLAALGPLLAWVAFRASKRAARIALVAAVPGFFLVASLAYKAVQAFTFHASMDDPTIWFGPLARLDGFALGMLLAVFVAARARTTPSARVLVGARIVGIIVIAGAFFLRESTEFFTVFYHSICAVGFAALIVPSIIGPIHASWERALAWRPLIHLGEVSFGVYLLHEPLLVELAKRGIILQEGAASFVPNAILLSIIAVGFATLTYRYLELPAMRLRHWVTPRGVQLPPRMAIRLRAATARFGVRKEGSA